MAGLYSVSVETPVKSFQLFQEGPVSSVLLSGTKFNLSLSISICVSSPQQAAQRQRQEFATPILAIDEGRGTNDDIVQWPLEGIIPDNKSKLFANAIYPTLTNPAAPLPSCHILRKSYSCGEK
jgi:hypothetical protein